MGHTLNDLYSNFLPQLLPFLLVLMPGFTSTQAAILVASFNISSSLFQPIFGYVVDGKGQSWLIYARTIWMAFSLSLTGLVHGCIPMAALAAIAGLGPGARAERPIQGRLPVGLRRLRQFRLRHGALPRRTGKIKETATLTVVWKAIRKSARELGVILGVISVRTAAYTGLLALLPLYFHGRNVSNIDAGRMLTLMLFTGAFGGIAGEFISDKWGRKPLIVGSLLLATPLFFGFLASQGILSLVFLALAGAALLSSFSVTTVAAQEAIPEHKAMAAGLRLGFVNGLGALAVIFVCKIADVLGLPTAIAILVSLPFAAGLVGLRLRHHPGYATARR